ncbi:hypothetical protein [Gordonia sp. FQ]|uniref:hypothetical protein n=1 Tax=Gordonia sp. FQ TaxID=3446634 RepID=UPI003F8656E0
MSGADVVTVAGLAGAEPAELAVLLPGTGPPVALLALDLTTTAGAAERALLAGLRAPEPGGPAREVALVGVGAGLDPDWPRRLAAARNALDPRHRLPVFAVSLEAARAGDRDGSGLTALAAWCADPDPAEAAEPAETAEPSATPRPPDPAPSPAGAERARARLRAERLAGARTGLAAVRTQAAADIRAGALEVTRLADAACERLGRGGADPYRAWLAGTLTEYRDRVDAEVRGGVDHVRAAALAGVRVPEPSPSPSGTADVVVPDAPARRLSPEDLVVLALGGSAGLGLGRVTVAPLVRWAGLGAPGTVLTVLVGLAIAAGVVAVRRQAATRSAARRSTAEAVAAVRGGLEHAVAGLIGAAEAELTRESWNRTARWCVQPSRNEGVGHERLD